MPKTPQQIVEEQQAREVLQDMRETQSAQDAAATDEVPGDQLARAVPQTVVVQGDPALADEPAVEEDPDLLGRLQDPHAASRPQVKTAVFLNSYGQKVRAAI